MCSAPPITGELPKVPSLPARSLLLRKLVQLEHMARPAAAAAGLVAPEQQRSAKQQVRRTAAGEVGACVLLQCGVGVEDFWGGGGSSSQGTCIGLT